jgi:hypothetical protein
MVQQWLREYRIPSHLTIRERVRLRQYRYQGLLDWGVPQIISILPILLQIALVLFLAGLCYLLASLDKVVAKAFIIFVGIALSIYSAFIVLPIAFRRCPYKNPVAHVISTLYSVFVLLCWLVIYFYTVIIILVVTVLSRLRNRIDIEVKVTNMYLKISRVTSAMYTTLFNPRIDLGRSEYWTAREINALQSLKDLDRDALIWAPSAVSKGDLPRLDQCLEDLSPDQQLQCVMSWTAQALNIHVNTLDDGVSTGASPFGLDTLKKIDTAFAHRFRASLLQVLPSKFERYGWNVFKIFYGPSVLVMLRHIVRTRAIDSDFTARYVQRVMAIRDSQTTEDINSLHSGIRLPTPCLFEISTILRYDFTEEGALLVLD